MNKPERAVKLFEKDCNCSQAVFSVFAPGLGLDRDTACAVSSGFGGGMGRMGGVCGAVTGAFMAIGLDRGRIEEGSGNDEAKERACQAIGEFVKQFTGRNGTIVCRDLIGCDLGTAEGCEEAEKRNVFTEICPKLVRDAAEILETLL